MTYEFIYEFMYMKEIVTSIPEIMCTKVPNEEDSCLKLKKTVASNSVKHSSHLDLEFEVVKGPGGRLRDQVCCFKSQVAISSYYWGRAL